MKRIETNLTEKQFFANLEQFCRSTSRLYEECNSFETFVYKIKDKQFWIGKYTSVGRTHGFLSTRLNCRYAIAQNMRIVVTYYRAKHPFHLMAHFLMLIVGLYFCIDSFICVFKQGKLFDLIIALGFLIVGIWGLIIKPSKEWDSLEGHLYNICGIMYNP